MYLNGRRIVAAIGFILLQLCVFASANLVFHVHHKFPGKKWSLKALKSHDATRRRRFLSAAELPLGGDSRPTSAALYFTKLKIGSPPKDFHVQVDTGSDLLWVNCIECENCPKESDLGIPLRLYDPKASSTAKKVGCDDEFCKATFTGQADDCKAGMLCAYGVKYGDGSSTSGYFVKDNVKIAQVSGDSQITAMSGNIVIGCGARQSGQLGSSDQALDGILGFGQSNRSLLSQLNSGKKVRKMFSHCLDGKGGGIFAIGEVVHPKIKTTPLVNDPTHYNIELKSIDVNGEEIKLPTSILDFIKKQTVVVDSGTTLAYFPDKVYNQLMEKIMVAQPNKKPHVVEKMFKCYKYSGNIDDGFPVVNLHFAKSLSFKVKPHQYFFQITDDEWCIGFQNSNLKEKTGEELTLLGDLVLSDKFGYIRY